MIAWNARLTIAATLLCCCPATSNAAVLAGWDVVPTPPDQGGNGEGALVGAPGVAEVSILSGDGGNGVDLNGVELALDGDGVASNTYRGVFTTRGWVYDDGVNPVDPDVNWTFQISSTAGLDLDTFEMVVRRQAQNTPTRVRNIYASFSTDGETFTDYVAPDLDGEGATDQAETASLPSNLLAGRTDPQPTLAPWKIWDLSEYTGVTDLWVRVQGRSSDDRLSELSTMMIDDRGDLDTDDPVNPEANANNPFEAPYDTGNSSDGFDVILTGDLASLLVPGDYDGNGLVENADYDLWSQQYGSSVTPGEGADGNGDGLVDAADYVVWRNLYEAPAAAAVPEPAGFALLAALSVAAWGRRR